MLEGQLRGAEVAFGRAQQDIEAAAEIVALGVWTKLNTKLRALNAERARLEAQCGDCGVVLNRAGALERTLSGTLVKRLIANPEAELPGLQK